MESKQNSSLLALAIAAGLLFTGQARPAAAQQIHSSAPLVDSRSGFYEYYGFDWGFRSGHFFFGLTAAQGSNRSIMSSTPSLTVMNGGAGAITSTSLRPFVRGLTPVVGDGAMAAGFDVPAQGALPMTLTSPLQERLSRLAAQSYARSQTTADDVPELSLGNDDGGAAPLSASGRGGSLPSRDSSATHGDVSLAEIQASRARATRDAAEELRALIDRAEHAERAGRYGAARIFYGQAASRAAGDLHRQLTDHLATLKGK